MSVGLAAPSAVATDPTRDREARPFSFSVVAAIILGHVVLGIAGAESSLVPLAHAGTVALLLLLWAFGSQRLDQIGLITAYGALGDIYWRMTGSRTPWELSKYLLVIGSVTILVRFARQWNRPAQPILFLGCLVPGIVLTMLDLGLPGSRGTLVDAALGPVALGIGVLAARTLVLSETDAWNLCWVMVGALVLPLTITTYYTLRSHGLTFTSESNFEVTGGYGPNQVSSALGLLILLCVLLGFQRRGLRFLALLLPLAAWALWATFLTFSRGGLYSVVIAGALMVLVGLSQRGARMRSLTVLAVGAVGFVIIFSSVNDFSGNWLDTRYSGAESSKSTAGRTNLMEQDLRVFEEHPLLGVGVGQSKRQHDLSNIGAAATHTEPTRLLAEHGLLGVMALGLLVAMVVAGYRSSLTYWNRLLVVGAATWSLTTMLHAATRLGAVSLLFALSQLRVESDARRAPGWGRAVRTRAGPAPVRGMRRS